MFPSRDKTCVDFGVAQFKRKGRPWRRRGQGAQDLALTGDRPRRNRRDILLSGAPWCRQRCWNKVARARLRRDVAFGRELFEDRDDRAPGNAELRRQHPRRRQTRPGAEIAFNNCLSQSGRQLPRQRDRRAAVERRRPQRCACGTTAKCGSRRPRRHRSRYLSPRAAQAVAASERGPSGPPAR